jgi:DnaJ homolog subfamily C member 19
MKYIILLGLATLACKLFLKRWPWELLGFPHATPEMERARALLGVRRDASRAEIIEAHKRLVSIVHPDRGGTSETVIEANAARDLLLSALRDRHLDK